MRLFNSSLFFIIISFSSLCYGQSFTGKECLGAEYNYDIINSNYLFGLANERLLIKKASCVINIEYKKILKMSWEIDVCREPIHMKVVEYGKQSIYKRFTKCQKNDQTDYCSQLQKLNLDVLDFGLMYAQGSRETLASKHGKTYCLATLVRQYLGDGRVFSQADEKLNLFQEEMTPIQVLHEAPIIQLNQDHKDESVPAPEMIPPVDETVKEEVKTEENSEIRF